jgi:hypothetical protein
MRGCTKSSLVKCQVSHDVFPHRGRGCGIHRTPRARIIRTRESTSAPTNFAEKERSG